MARSLNIVIGADIEKLRKGLQEAIVAIQSSGSKMSAETAKAATEIEKKLAAISTKNPTAGTVRQLTNLAMEARALGPEFQNVANDIIKQAGRIKDSIGDARAEVSYFASDTRRLDAVIGTVQAVAGAYSVVEGATALMGVESENLTKTMVKLQAVMAVVTGLQEIQTLLQEESAAMQGLLALRTTVLTAAQTAYASAVGTATGVQRAFNLAMAAAPWALAATALAAIVIAVGNYQDRIKKAAEQQKLFNEINSETQKNFEEEVKSVSGLLAVVNNHNASMVERKNALAEIQKIYPDFLANQNLDKVGSEELKTATTNLTNEIYKQAKAKAAFAKLQELSAKMLEYELGKQQAQLSTQAEINRLYASGASPAQVQKFIESQKNVGTIAEQNAAKIQSQIDAIINMSNAQGLSLTPVTKATTAIKEQTKAVEGLTTAQTNQAAARTLGTPQFGAGAPTIEAFAAVTGPMQQYAPVLKQATGEQIAIMSDYEQRMTEAAGAINNAFNSMTAEGVEAFGDMIGGILSGQITSFDDFGKALLGSVAKFMRAFGTALIATATASKAFKEFILKRPEIGIAAGIALVAGSAAISGMLKKGPQPTAFAEGGIVSGPTLGLVGEYPNARNNPEVIAPLDKLKGMLKTGDNSSGFVASTTIAGRDLAIVLERYNKDSKRG
jgi:hypothetical protein